MLGHSSPGGGVWVFVIFSIAILIFALFVHRNVTKYNVSLLKSLKKSFDGCFNDVPQSHSIG